MESTTQKAFSMLGKIISVSFATINNGEPDAGIANATEIVRGGIAGIPKGQWDAGFALGMNRYQIFMNIILPQALRNILSPLAGQFISTIKDSAIMSVISIQELTFHGMEVMATTFLTFEVWITITVLYFTLTFSLSRLTVVIENHLASQH